MTKREIEQDDILDLVNCAEDYGHWNNVCMYSLYEWAKPVTDEDILFYAKVLGSEDDYEEEDIAESITRLTEWRDKYYRIEEKKVASD